MKENWTFKKLGEVCELEYGTRVVQARDGGSIYPVYGGGGATFKMDLYNRENRVVVSRFAMSTKCTRKVNGKFFLNDSGLTIKSVDVTLSQSYLDTCILALNDKIYSLGRGAAQKNLKVTDLVNIPIPIPPMEEQERIVAELDLLQSVIDKKKAQLDEYDKLAQSIFYEMFGDPIDNPKKWEVKKLGEIFDVTSSKRIYQTELVNDGVPFLKVSELVNLIENNSIEPSAFITNSAYDDLKMKGVVPSCGDLLVTARGTIGKCYIVKQNDRFYFQDGMVTWLKNEKNLADANYIKALMNFDSFKLYLAKNAKHTTIDYISIQQLAQMNLCLPPLSLQQSFAEKIEAIEHQKELVKQSLNEVKTLFDSRMDYYFN